MGPETGVEIDPKDEARQWATNANLVYKNPTASLRRSMTPPTRGRAS